MRSARSSARRLNIEKHLEDFGIFCQDRLKSQGDSHFVEGFVSFSLLICIGAMAIVGSLQDGLSGDASLLIAKAIIDGIAAVVFAASLGKGVFLSILPLGVYQGGLTLLARFIRPWMTDELIAQMSCVGSVLIFAVSLNMIRKDKIKVGNLLPAVFLPVVFLPAEPVFSLYSQRCKSQSTGSFHKLWIIPVHHPLPLFLKGTPLMKKIISLLLAGLLCANLTAPALAGRGHGGHRRARPDRHHLHRHAVKPGIRRVDHLGGRKRHHHRHVRRPVLAGLHLQYLADPHVHLAHERLARAGR